MNHGIKSTELLLKQYSLRQKQLHVHQCNPVQEQQQIALIDWIDYHTGVEDVTTRLLEKQ